jgi:hypothetical protein
MGEWLVNIFECCRGVAVITRPSATPEAPLFLSLKKKNEKEDLY